MQTKGEAPPRYERKFLLERHDRAAAALLVLTHPAHFSAEFADRHVNNVYLDGAARRAYFDHVDGIGTRHKLRLRWYGAAAGRIEGAALELKSRRGMVVTKRGWKLPPFQFDAGLDWDELLRAALPGVPAPIAERLRGSSPVLVNRYRRAYYRSADRVFRLTVDDDLSFALLVGGAMKYRSWSARRPWTILELKYAPAADVLANRVAAALPFRVSRSSKYCLGVQALAIG